VSRYDTEDGPEYNDQEPPPEPQIDDRTPNDRDPEELHRPSFHELWAEELDELARFERLQELGVRAWSRLVGLSLESNGFRIRSHRACLISAACDRLYIKLHGARS
jgi:hypothetical protein